MSTDNGQELVQELFEGRITRRTFVLRAIALGFTTSSIGTLLAACGGGGDTPNGGTGPTATAPAQSGGVPTTAAATPGAAAVSPPAGYPPGYVGPRLSPKSPITPEKTTLRVVVPQNAEVGDWSKNVFTQWYEERTNVHVEWMVVPGEDALTKVNAMIASGDVPDVFMSINFLPAQQMLYGSQGLFVPLNDLLDQHGVEIKQLFTEYPDAKNLITATDGNIYSMPNLNDCYHCWAGAGRMWIYKPWLDELGMKMPETTDEFEAVLKAFKEKDPNGNKQLDEIPLTKAVESGFDTYFMGAFLYNPGEPWLVLANGKVDAVFNKPEWREGLRYMNRLYKQGLIAKESFTQTPEQLQRIGNKQGEPVLGATREWYWGSFLTIDQSKADARWKDYVTVPILKGPGGAQVSGWNYYGAVAPGAYVITKACKNPDVAVKWADGQYELEAICRSYAGVLGEDWRWAEKGELGINGKQALWKQIVTWPPKTGRWWAQLGVQYRSNDFRLSEAVDAAKPTFEKPLYEYTKQDYFPYREDQAMQLPPLYMDEDQAAQTGEIATTINNYVSEMLAKFTNGQVDVTNDGEWNKYVSTFDEMGLSTYLQIHQAAYDAKYKQ